MAHADVHPTQGPFEISGGALCLDFANTWGNQADPASDRLTDYTRLLAFARQTGQITGETAAAYAQAAAATPEEAAGALASGRELRQVIYRIFSSVASGRDVAPADLDRINGLLGEALSQRRLARQSGAFEWTWRSGGAADLRLPIWPVVESAAALMTSDDLNRVRECAAEDCNWLFLDRSRGGTRRWCSMSSCGNRAKARRHYHRRREH